MPGTRPNQQGGNRLGSTRAIPRQASHRAASDRGDAFLAKDHRKHDWDNHKALYDALNGILWDDDGQIKDARVMVEYDRKEPRVEMRVWELL